MLAQERLPESTPAAPEPGSLEASIAEATQIAQDTNTAQEAAEVAEQDAILEESAPSTTEEPGATPVPEAEAAEPSVAEPVVEAPPAQPAVPETTPDRTYTPEEWGKRESAYRTNDSELRNQLATLQQQIAQAEQNRLAAEKTAADATAIDQQVRDHAASEEARLTPIYGAEDARRAVQDPTFLKNARDAATGLQAQQNVVQQQQGAQIEAFMENAGRQVRVAQLQAEFDIPESDLQYVVEATSPEKMLAAAQRFGTPRGQASTPAAAEPKAESPVPAGSAERMETGESEAPALDDDAREALINNKNPADWTPEDIAFQDRKYR